MSGSLIPNAKQQFLDANGNPLAGGFVYFYIPSTTTFKNTYQNAALTILNSNPIILDSAGEAIIYGSGSYRQIVNDVNGNLIWDQTTVVPITLSDVGDVYSAANGSSLIGYNEGASGAVNRTVQAKLQEQVSVKDFGAVGNGTTDDTTAIQNAINSGARSIYIPAGRYKVTSTLNLCNLSVSGVGLKIYGDCVQYDDGTTTAASVILSNPGTNRWVAEIIGSQFVTIEDVMFISTGSNSALGGILLARSTSANYAQNNSLRRVIVKIDTNIGNSIALGNNCAEQFVCDECWFQADIGYVTTLANEYGFVSQYTTIANSIYSNTAQAFRLTTFTPLTSAGIVMQGLATANFDTCVVIPKSGNTYPNGIVVKSSTQAYQDCSNVTFTGQIEYCANAIRLEGNSRDLNLNFSTSNITNSHVIAYSITNHYNLYLKTTTLNTTGVNVFSTTGGTVYVHGGQIVIGTNLKMVDNNIVLKGTDIDGGNANLNNQAVFYVFQNSSYHTRFSNSKLWGSSVWNPGTIASGTVNSFTFTLTGVAVGDKVDVFFPYASQGAIVQGSVDSVDTIKLVLLNMTGSPITFTSGTWFVYAERPTI